MKVLFIVSEGADDQGRGRGGGVGGDLRETQLHKPGQAQGQDWEAHRVGEMGKADSQSCGAFGKYMVQLRPKGGDLPKVTLQLILPLAL